MNIDSSNKEELLKFFNSNSFYKTSELSMLTGIPTPTLRLWMKRCGYQPPETPDTLVLKHIGGFRRKKNVIKVTQDIWDNKKWFEFNYNVLRLGLPTISKMIDRCIPVVVQRLRKYGIKTRSIQDCNTSTNVYCDRDWCNQLYIIDQCSLKEMADIAKVSPYTIINWLTKFKIPIRDRKSALQVAARKRLRMLRRQ